MPADGNFSNNTMKLESLRVVPEERPRVDVSACLDGYRVWLLNRPYRDFKTLSNAARCASALMTLDALDCLPPETPTAA